jgi:drug/metabolite transporter (DMT)-like permease
VILGVIIFSEAPSGLQLVGVAAILTGLVLTTRRRAGTTTPVERA